MNKIFNLPDEMWEDMVEQAPHYESEEMGEIALLIKEEDVVAIVACHLQGNTYTYETAFDEKGKEFFTLDGGEIIYLEDFIGGEDE